ncbi:hypothetical protein CLV43_102668 [Umezawaea tangerina]|uniref:Uncharacterized protein n=1 Tax=Umezawaea tangerina TaxID=84725 RepID=A0A2T0THJ0_9PSEU|nr:hypothetical protein CLV43_102668 [Umezawaea tangerina]
MELGLLGAVDANRAALPGTLDRGAGTLLSTTGGAAVGASAPRGLTVRRGRSRAEPG